MNIEEAFKEYAEYIWYAGFEIEGVGFGMTDTNLEDEKDNLLKSFKLIEDTYNKMLQFKQRLEEENEYRKI